MYENGENGQKINQLRIANGKMPRFQGTSFGYSYTFNNATFTKLFDKLRSVSIKSSKKDDDGDTDSSGSERQSEPPPSSPPPASSSSRGGSNSSAGEGLDASGYYKNEIPWSLSFNFSLNMSQDRAHFNQETREYPYMYTKSLGVSGNISPTKNWSLNMSTSYDFEAKKFATMNCNITRKMHCWNMTASFIPIGPYQHYSFTIAITSAILKDIKYSQSSNYRDAGAWGNAGSQ